MASKFAGRLLAVTAPLGLAATMFAPTVATPLHSFSRFVIPFVTAPGRTVYAGGATLPEIAYVNSNANPGPVTSAPAGSVFNVGLGTSHVQYCATGSGAGKKIFDNITTPPNSFTVHNPCIAPTSNLGGFGGPIQKGAQTLRFPDVTGSDAPLSQTEYSAFTKVLFGVNRTEPSQIPFITGAVALFYHNSKLPNRTISFTPSQICSILNGSVTNWSAFGYPSLPLNFVFRADGSGTSFSFLNFIVRQTACKLPSGNAVNVSQQFAEPNPVPNPVVTSVGENVLPPTAATMFFSAKGNGGVAACIAGLVANACLKENTTTPATVADGTIGYVEAANTRSFINAATGRNIALVNNQSSVKNLPEAANSIPGGANLVQSAAVVTQTNYPPNGKGGLASVVALSPADNCVFVVNPNAYNAGLRGYPIVAVSNLLFSYTGNNSNSTVNNTNITADLINLAQTLNGNSVGANYTFNNHLKIGGGAGGAITINTVDASTPAVSTGTTGFATLPKIFPAAYAPDCIHN